MLSSQCSSDQNASHTLDTTLRNRSTITMIISADKSRGVPIARMYARYVRAEMAPSSRFSTVIVLVFLSTRFESRASTDAAVSSSGAFSFELESPVPASAAATPVAGAA